MDDISKLQKELSSLSTRIRNSVRNTLHEESTSLLADFKAHSPEDTGEYKSLWFISKSRFLKGNSIASIAFRNNDPKAYLMEFGAAKKEAPWFYPGRKKRTGKLIVRHGRVWAGGLSPGHNKTVGGAINKVLYNNSRRQLKIVKNIANNIVRAII